MLWYHNPKRLPFAKCEEPLPTLPTKRPRSLSVVSADQSPTSPDRQPECRFFSLPWEIRRSILVFAFGAGTVHMHLQPNYYEQIVEESTKNGFFKDPCVSNDTITNVSNNEVDGPHEISSKPLDEDIDQQPGHANLPLLSRADKYAKGAHVGAWQWWGCVCHRQTGGVESSGAFGGSQPFNDTCLVGSASCGEDAACPRSNCFIGIMGWLCCCRRAYVEAIDILYATNVFHINSDPLIRNISTLILPQRLASIKWLELAIQLKVEDGLDLASLFRPIHDVFRGLRRLKLRLGGKLDPRPFWSQNKDKSIYHVVEITVIHAVDDLYNCFGAQLEELELTLGPRIFSGLAEMTQKRDGTMLSRPPDIVPIGDASAFFRPVKGEADNVTCSRGYWICPHMRTTAPGPG